jgi:hypothetical protein
VQWWKAPDDVVTAKYGSNNRTGLEDATNTTPHGNQRLHVQWWKAPDDVVTAKYGSNNRTGLEDATNTTPHRTHKRPHN